MTTVLFAGGGTGGHIYPNVAMAQRLVERRPDVTPHFLVSSRHGDADIVRRQGFECTHSPVRPLPPLSRPWRFIGFYLAWRRAVAETRALLRERDIALVVATGGYVSGPAIVAAAKLRVPRALVNLDAIPGKANRRLAGYGPDIFSVYETPILPGATIVGLPLRTASRGLDDPSEARAALGLDPDKPTLFVTGATHGAESIIRSLMAIIASADLVGVFSGWQVFHQCGTFDVETLQEAYDQAGVDAKVVAYCDQMGNAWRAATLTVSRAGAGSVAEAWANAAPTIFLPNPYHRDQHQRHNAQPVVATGGAVMIEDRIEPQANLAGLGATLQRLMGDTEAIATMRQALRDTEPADGASAVADWAATQLG